MAEDLWLPPGEMPLVHAGQTCFACKLSNILQQTQQNGDIIDKNDG